MKYETYFKDHLKLIEQQLQNILPPETQHPPVIHEAMRYSVLSGGKRFRPLLTLAACEATGGDVQDAILPALALELIHCYSLVHDDLPALDNDDMRRGQLTCHKKYGEAMAVLTGDALLTLAFQALSKMRDPVKAVRVLAEISTASGTYGMIGGQVADLVVKREDANIAMQDYISSHKTGKLITASAVCGAIAANASEETASHMLRYGECIGLAFQSVDDILDGDGYLGLVEYKEVVLKVRDLIARAKREIKSLAVQAKKLHVLADFLLQRIPKGNHVALDQ